MPAGRSFNMSLINDLHGVAIALFDFADQLKLSFSHPLPPSSLLHSIYPMGKQKVY